MAEVRGWLAKAVSDLRAAAHELTAVPPILDDLVFHCQRAVEKSFKAFLTWHDEVFRKTHSLEEIGEEYIRIDATLAPLVDGAVPLSEYAWKFRDPGEPDQPGREEADAALRVVRQVYQAIAERLPREAQPT